MLDFSLLVNMDLVSYNKLYSRKLSTEDRLKKMQKRLRLTEDILTSGIHKPYKYISDHLTGHKYLYHYTQDKNVKDILKNGLDPNKDLMNDNIKNIGVSVDKGIYLGDRSKLLPRWTVMSRYMDQDKSRDLNSKNKLGTMLEIKIPLNEYKKLKHLNHDPLSDISSFKYTYNHNKEFRQWYDKLSPLKKLKVRYEVNINYRGLKDNVAYVQDKIDPKYITKVDPNWYSE